jgi:hypothetical protein
MAIAAAGGRQHGLMREGFGRARLGRASLLAWSAVGVMVFAALVFWFDPTRLLTSLGDTDDATRMIEVRAWMSGASWFDLTLPRFDGADPLVSHWSRLIDAPLAVLLSGFEIFLPADEAELVVRALWPLLVFWAFVYLMAREVEICGGRAAALISIPLTVTCIIGIVQFLPGRIDHHNAMILCAVIGILQLARSFDDPRAGWSAGVLLGLGTAIGYEALALTAASLGAAALYGVLPNRSLLGPSRAAVAFAATLAVALAITTAPVQMFTSHCDVLSMNLVLLAASGAIGVSVVAAMEDRFSLIVKLALLALAGAAGLSLYAAAQPACLAGPFGEVDPELFPVWLGSVSETQSIFSLGSQLPTLGGMALAYFAAGLYCGLKLVRTDRDDAVRFLMLALLIALPLSFWQIKLLPYATFLPVPLLAVGLAQPPQSAKAPASRRRTLVTLAATLILVAVAGWLVMRMSAPSSTRVKEALKPVQDCQSTAAVSALAPLAPGLALADVNLGPYIVALSKLDVLSAPYHRLGKSIIEANRILLASPDEAERRLRADGVRYVVTCDGLDSTTPRGEVPTDALQKLLFAGKPPAFLESVPLSVSTPLKVWRLKS